MAVQSVSSCLSSFLSSQTKTVVRCLLYLRRHLESCFSARYRPDGWLYRCITRLLLYGSGGVQESSLGGFRSLQWMVMMYDPLLCIQMWRSWSGAYVSDPWCRGGDVGLEPEGRRRDPLITGTRQPQHRAAASPSLNAAWHIRLSWASVLKACSWYVVLKPAVERIQIVVVFCLSIVSTDVTRKKKRGWTQINR